jgi:hypothetical protein
VADEDEDAKGKSSMEDRFRFVHSFLVGAKECLEKLSGKSELANLTDKVTGSLGKIQSPGHCKNPNPSTFTNVSAWFKRGGSILGTTAGVLNLVYQTWMRKVEPE